MKHLLVALVLGMSLITVAKAQKVTGVVQDNLELTPLAKATVSLLKPDSSTVLKESVTNNKGEFTLADVKPGSYILRISSVGYTAVKQGFIVKNADYDFGTIAISKAAQTLSEVVINAATPVRMKGDTAEFSASQYKVNPDATTEDLIKKMPGVTVDRQGNVTAQGETVKKVTVDGRDFFGDDATAALRNLPSEVVDKIQVFDRLSDQAQLTGFDDGNTTKSINIVTKANMRQGNFGRIYAGYGTDDRYAGGGNISFFNNARRISIIGLTNNINQQNFSSEDLVGASGGGMRGGGGRGGGGMGGPGGGFGGGGNNYFVGQQSGIAKTNSIGLNFSDAWGKKVDVSASYFFNNSNLSNNQIINRQNIIQGNTTYYDDTTTSHSENFNHRLNVRLTYKIDSANQLIFTLGSSYQKNNAFLNDNGVNTMGDHQQITSQTLNPTTSDLTGFNGNANILFRHSFKKMGRSISINVGTNLSDRTGHTYNDAINTYYKPGAQIDTVFRFTNQKSHTNNYNVNLVYTEPIAKNTQLQINYNPATQKSNSNQSTYDYDHSTGKYDVFNSVLSNIYDNTYNTQNAGVTFRRGDKNNMVSLGGSYQYSDLFSSNGIHFTFNNFLGNAMARIKTGTYGSLMLNYRGSVSAPSITQLQNVINTSNQLFYSTGNPDLLQQYTHRLMTRFSYSNRVTQQSFFANAFVSVMENYVTNATYTATQDSTLAPGVILHKGSQLTKPINLDGYFNARTFFTYSAPLKFIKTNLNMNAGFSYAKQPGLVNEVKNISNSYNYNVGVVLASNISEHVDFNISYTANFNNVNNSVRPDQNNNYIQQSAGITFNLLSKKGTFFQNDLSNQSYSGLSAGFNQSYWLWNMSVGQKFLKGQRGEIKASVFDLLKQNKAITRDVTESYIQDTRNQVLQQYFMLTFTYKLKNFGKAKPNNQEGERRFFPGGGYPGGGYPGGPPML